MKLFREIILVFGIYYIGEFLAAVLPLPLPGNLIGMLLLLLLLCLRVVRLDQISMVSDFLLGHLSFFFIPAGVGLLSVLGLMQDSWLYLLIICAVTTAVTMGVSGSCVQWLMKKKEEK